MKYIRAAQKAQKVLVIKHADSHRIVITAQKPSKSNSTSSSSASSSSSSPKPETKLHKPKPITPARRAVFAAHIAHERGGPPKASSSSPRAKEKSSPTPSSRSERPPRSTSSRHASSHSTRATPSTSIPASAPSPSPSPTPAFKKQQVEPFNIDKLVLSCAVNSGYDMPAWMMQRDISTPKFKTSAHYHESEKEEKRRLKNISATMHKDSPSSLAVDQSQQATT